MDVKIPSPGATIVALEGTDDSVKYACVEAADTDANLRLEPPPSEPTTNNLF